MDGALIFVVKSYSSGPSEGPASADMVRIVHTPGAWGSISSLPMLQLVSLFISTSLLQIATNAMTRFLNGNNKFDHEHIASWIWKLASKADLS